jgi:MFS family permease
MLVYIYKHTFNPRLIKMCAMLNGIAGAVPFGGASPMSATWFPQSERTTATAIVTFFNYLGFALIFAVGE